MKFYFLPLESKGIPYRIYSSKLCHIPDCAIIIESEMNFKNFIAILKHYGNAQFSSHTIPLLTRILFILGHITRVESKVHKIFSGHISVLIKLFEKTSGLIQLQKAETTIEDLYIKVFEIAYIFRRL